MVATDMPDGAPSDSQVTDERFDDQPRLVFWEMTKACPLACVHCRAAAQSAPLPGELTTTEGMKLIDELAAGPAPHPILVLTGGDCLTRPDIVELAAYAKHRGVPVAIAPSVSARLADPLLAQLREQGVSHVSLSLDGATARTHEEIRRVPGHFRATLDAIGRLREAGFRVQINTAVMKHNVRELADIAVLLHGAGVRVWEVFFLVNVGRGDKIDDIDPAEAEDVCHFLVDAARYGMVVRTVEAPFFRRVTRQRAALDHPGAPTQLSQGELHRHGELYRELADKLVENLGGPRSRVLAPTISTRDGKGVIFVGYDGAVHPSGFLPLELGNVRDAGLLDIYKNDKLLGDIRAARFTGRCGACDYKDLCGGSRARAYATTGDPLGDDPACIEVAGGSAA